MRTVVPALILTVLVLFPAGVRSQDQESKPPEEHLSTGDDQRYNNHEPLKPGPATPPDVKQNPAPDASLSTPAVPPAGAAPTPAREATWREPQTGMEFVRLPGGCYRMGSPAGEEGRFDDEGPVHEVCVDGFWMGVHEVTVGQFRKFAEVTGYKTDAEQAGKSWGIGADGGWGDRAGLNWRNVGFPQDDSHPVVQVSWSDAVEYAKWLTAKTGKTFRLPTEAEWEYGCRADSKTARSWGDNPDDACAYANVADLEAKEKFPDWSFFHNCRDGYVFTAPAGSYRPNNYGLHDMLGNTWEWCMDIYARDGYRKHSRDNPIYAGDSGSADRVLRGGGWGVGPRGVRCAHRSSYAPDDRGVNIGFRLVGAP